MILVIGVLCRLIGTFLVTAGQGFTLKERGFFAFSWIPKATVQAAIGGIVLDNARGLDNISDEDRKAYTEFGSIVLTMAVLSIILTAPSGAILINTLGTRWLSDDTPTEDEEAGEGDGDGAPKVEEVGDDTVHTARKLNNGNAPDKASVYKVDDVNGPEEVNNGGEPK